MDIIHPIPYVEWEFTVVILGQKITYHIHTFLYALQFLKIYHIFRLIGVFTIYTNLMSQKYCVFHGGESDQIFSLKCFNKDYPYFFLITLMFSVIVVFGIVLRMFEILNVEGGGHIDYKFYANGIWNVAVAVTTGKKILNYF
jgi:hypothetical protein